MENNVVIDRNTIIRVNVPGTSGFYRLRCEAFFTVNNAAFKRMMKVLQADEETAADNARIVSEWAFQFKEIAENPAVIDRWGIVNAVYSDWEERPESAVISSAVSDLEKLNKKMKTGRKVLKEIRGDDIYFTNNSIVLKHGNAAVYEDYETCVKTSNTYERIFSGYENKAFLFSQVLPDTKTLKIQGKTRGAKQTAYYVNAKGTAFNVNYIQYAAAVTDSRDIYFNPDGIVCYMAGNGFTVAIAQCAINFTDCANNIIITESRNTLAGMEVIYKYPCGDSLPVYRCVMEYFNGDHNTTYHPTKEAALNYAEETEKHYPGIIAGISINSGTIAGRMSWNEDGETFQAANIPAKKDLSGNTEAAEAKENNNADVPAGKELSNDEADAAIVSDASDASNASEKSVKIPEIDFSRLNTLFLNAYEKLYQTRAYDFDAVKRFDEGLTDHEKEILNTFVTFRNDFISSDRECTAFVYALDEIQKETAAADPGNDLSSIPEERSEKLVKDPEPMPEGMPETMPAVIPTKTAENGAEVVKRYDIHIDTKHAGNGAEMQLKSNAARGYYFRTAETGIPAGIEKMSICTNYTGYTNTTNYHNMLTSPTVPAMYRNDNMHNPHRLHNRDKPPFCAFCAPSAAFCAGENAFCDVLSGVPPGPPGMRVSSRWKHPAGIIQEL